MLAVRRFSFTSLVMFFTVLIYIYSYLISIRYFMIPNFLLFTGSGMFLFTLMDLSWHKNFMKVFSKECILWIVFVVTTFIMGFLLSPSLSDHMFMGIQTMQYLALCLCMVVVCYNSGDYNKYIYVLILVAFIAALFYIYDPYTISSGRYVTLGARSNPTSYSQIFIYAIWAVMYCMIINQKIKLWLGIPLISLFLYCIVISGSRKSFISFLILIITWFFLCYLPLYKKNVLKLIIVCMIFGIALYYIYCNYYVTSHLATRMTMLYSALEEESRYKMYIDGWKLFVANPIFGEGFWSFFYYYGTYSHNSIIEVLVSSGILGFILYFGAYFVAFKKILRYIKLTRKNHFMLEDNLILKQTLILLLIMTFNATSVVHIYKLDSYFIFGLIFGIVHIFDKKFNNSKVPLQT